MGVASRSSGPEAPGSQEKCDIERVRSPGSAFLLGHIKQQLWKKRSSPMVNFMRTVILGAPGGVHIYKPFLFFYQFPRVAFLIHHRLTHTLTRAHTREHSLMDPGPRRSGGWKMPVGSHPPGPGGAGTRVRGPLCSRGPASHPGQAWISLRSHPGCSGGMLLRQSIPGV